MGQEKPNMPNSDNSESTVRNRASRYEVRCDDCKKTIRMTDSVGESAAGGRCNDCLEVA